MSVNPTTVSQLLTMSSGEVVELPGFVSDSPIYFKLTQPSMMLLAKIGAIPNSLLNRATELFKKGSRSLDTDDKNVLGDMYDILIAIARSAMVEPTYDSIEEAGIKLTDSQLLAIFNYTQNGVNKLSQFREKQESVKPDIDISIV